MNMINRINAKFKNYIPLFVLAVIALFIVSACTQSQSSKSPVVTQPSTGADTDKQTESAAESIPSTPTKTTTTVNTATTPSAAKTVDVAIKSFTMNPKTLTINKGDTVRWTNQDSVAHTSTADDGTWDSDRLTNGESFSFTFTEAGTYTYHCTPHKGSMKGYEIIVE